MIFRQPFRGEYPITQRYGEVVPGVTYQNKPHTGIDYGCPQGTQILASADGTVMAAGWDLTGFGFRVIIRHEDGRATLYGHLDSISVNLNDEVKQGQEIGLSGRTGNVYPNDARGDHLHFEARTQWNNYQTHFDPMTLPLISVDDSINENVDDIKQNNNTEILPAGIYQVSCPYAYIRTWDSLSRDRILQKGERVYIFEDEPKRNESGLPFRYIGAGRCIAEYDIDGTKILEAINGGQEEN